VGIGVSVSVGGGVSVGNGVEVSVGRTVFVGVAGSIVTLGGTVASCGGDTGSDVVSGAPLESDRQDVIANVTARATKEMSFEFISPLYIRINTGKRYKVLALVFKQFLQL
jgi:hypothetical protein